MLEPEQHRCNPNFTAIHLHFHLPLSVLGAAGLDSLGAVEYVNLVSRRLNLQLPSTLIFDYPTAAAVTGFLAGKLAARQPAAAAAQAGRQATGAATAQVPRQLPDQSAAAAANSTRQPADGAVSIRATVLWPLMAASAMRNDGSIASLTLPQHDVIQAVPGLRWDPDVSAGLAADVVGAVAATRFGAFLQDVDRFDSGAFGLSGPEALAMDPQHRLLLASAAQLLATPGAFAAADGSSGSNGGSSDGLAPMSDTGVFVGISWTEYHEVSKACGQPVGASTAQGAVLSVACGR